MKSQRSVFIFNFYLLTFSFRVALRLSVLALIFSSTVVAQKVAVLTPDKAETSREFAENLETRLAERSKVLDNSLSEAAYLSDPPVTPFNLTTEESKRIGSAIGCDSFILIRSATQRRSAYRRNEYYEAYAVVFVVSSRTGRLLFWKLQRFEASKPEKARKMLADSTASLASEITDKLHTAIKGELSEPESPAMEEVPEETSPAAKNFRAPIPYRRVKPEYTAQASLYDVTATVDLVVDLDANGSILRTEVVRWSGFGLDESVEKTVRAMNWRPAERGGKTLPMRFLLRYNFKRIDKE